MSTKKTGFKFATFTAFFFIVAGMLFFNPLTAMACGYGNSGGSDFVPQRQAPYGGNQAAGAGQTAAAISQDQAKTIVTGHVNRLNPDLVVGNINDAGGFFEVEVTNKAKEVVQMLGVDKYSGRLMLLN
ncbi:MAG: hypothetical protein KKE44_22335 [Proteobacteria bacterium]|nr:hypothetical protein [Pseudomonadota bacterium]MBU1585475.1 hypothetical protein [Pseudomonadota bacterium]MBU2454803.1 hypothetical protein [Pseudomonadota bacterium]MBU2627819.1 hypothetical protein [Pseudomonadota bacterium]